MISLEELKKGIERFEQLENITQAVEQSSASYIVKMRGKMLSSRAFYEEAWNCYNLYQKIVYKSRKNKQESRRVILLITPNQGMYGSLLSEAINTTTLRHNAQKGDIAVVGKKGHVLSRMLSANIKHFDLPDDFSYQTLEPAIDYISKYSDIDIVYPKYLSAFEQKVELKSLSTDSDIEPPSGDEMKLLNLKRYILDPDQLTLEAYFNKTVTGLILFRYFNEAMLAYRAAQMTAMRRAHDNAHIELISAKFNYSKNYRELVDGRLREVNAARKIIGEEEA